MRTTSHIGQHAADAGFALPAVLFLMVIMLGVSVILSLGAQEGARRVSSEQGIQNTYLVAEGSLHRQIADMSIYSNLWDQQAPISTKPNSYTQYSPSAFSATNGVPACTTGAACHRNYYPLGGGLLKNFGPLDGAGGAVDAGYSIGDQLDIADPPTFDVSLAGLSGWTQVERLDETRPDAGAVGGSLSSSVAEGGNAKKIRFRLTGSALRKVRNRTGAATLIAVIEMPVM